MRDINAEIQAVNLKIERLEGLLAVHGDLFDNESGELDALRRHRVALLQDIRELVREVETPR